MEYPRFFTTKAEQFVIAPTSERVSLPYGYNTHCYKLLQAFAQGVTLTNESARLICGGAGSSGDRRLRAVVSWLRDNGYSVEENTFKATMGGRCKSFRVVEYTKLKKTMEA